MMHFKLYRMIKVIFFGHRSFVKDKDWPVKSISYILIKGDYPQHLIDNLTAVQGFVEEEFSRSRNG